MFKQFLVKIFATLGPVGKTCGLGQSEHYNQVDGFFCRSATDPIRPLRFKRLYFIQFKPDLIQILHRTSLDIAQTTFEDKPKFWVLYQTKPKLNRKYKNIDQAT